jgi:hypothetical protein
MGDAIPYKLVDNLGKNRKGVVVCSFQDLKKKGKYGLE